MQIKKYSSRTVPDALAAVRRELGADAVILSTRRAGTGDRSFEVVAAVDEPSPASFPRVDREGNPVEGDVYPRRPRAVATGGRIVETGDASASGSEWSAGRSARGRTNRVSSEDVTAPSSDRRPRVEVIEPNDDPPTHRAPEPRSQRGAPAETASGGLDGGPPVNRVSLLDELEGLRGRLETMTDLLLAAAPHDLSVRARRMHLRLTESGLDPRMATAVVRRAERSATDDDDRALVAALSASIRPGGALESGVGQQVVALVGPTGVGKTTTCAKIAARLALGEGRQVALISADSFRVGGAQQLGFYGEILEVPFHTAHDRPSLLAAIKRSGNAEVILVDTTGRGSVDVEGATEIAETLSADPRTQSWLVLSATSRIEDNLSALRTFARVRPSGLCLTKLDETASHGAGATVAIRSALPLRYLTDGQTVPDDLHPASPDQVARLVLEGRSR
jgi:flagellar biosynthesis protein FlhF